MSPDIVGAIEVLHQFMEQSGCTTIRMWVGRDGGKYDGNRYLISMMKAMDYDEDNDEDEGHEEFV